MTLQTIQQIDKKWTKDDLTDNDKENVLDWHICGIGDNLHLRGLGDSKAKELIKKIDEKCGTLLINYGLLFSKYVHSNETEERKKTYNLIKEEIQKVKDHIHHKGAQIEIWDLQEFVEELIEERCKQTWKNGGIHAADERYALRHDGDVEWEYDGDLGADNSVEGECFDVATILTRDEAWDLIFQSDQFKSYLEHEAKNFINGDD